MATADRREHEHVPKLVRKLREERAKHQERGIIYRTAFVIAGFIVLAAGVAMLALPGPAFAVIPIGLFLLALQFTWAERLMEKAIEQGDKAKDKATETSPLQRVLIGAAIATAAAGAITAAILWDIPLLPV